MTGTPPGDTSGEPLPLATGFVRIGVLVPPDKATPGQLAQATGLAGELLGPIQVLGEQAYVDVQADHADTARAQLDQVGPTQVIGRNVRQIGWRWLRLGLGRNHGLTIGQLRKVLERVEAGSLGRITINNTHTLVGIREDLWDAVRAKLEAVRINGRASKPGEPQPGEARGSAAYMGPANREG